MPRHARIDIPGLLQHVIVRGIERSNIFLDDDDREDFVARMGRLLDETRTVCYAWALLDNHFHLLLMPTEQSLARFMRRLLTGYAVYFNRRHLRSGHLFQNRYKSIVCDRDAYLLELIRYIHLNPLRANVVSSLNLLADFRWSGHRQLLGRGTDQLIVADDVWSMFSRRKKIAIESYLQFLADGLNGNLSKISSGGRRASQAFDSSLTDQDLYDDRILGGGGFVERVLAAAELIESHVSLESIMERVANYFGVDIEELHCPSKVRLIANAKAVICYLSTRRFRIPGGEVAARLGYTRSAVSHASDRGKILFDGDDVLRDLLG